MRDFIFVGNPKDLSKCNHLSQCSLRGIKIQRACGDGSCKGLIKGECPFNILNKPIQKFEEYFRKTSEINGSNIMIGIGQYASDFDWYLYEGLGFKFLEKDISKKEFLESHEDVDFDEFIEHLTLLKEACERVIGKLIAIGDNLSHNDNGGKVL